jgi:PKD repeat protein
MKKIYMGLVLLIVILSSCQKSSSDVSKTASSTSAAGTTSAPLPSANFKINNTISPGNVWEALTLNFENTSTNGDTYLWDFGNGTTSTDKVPSNFSLAPCGMTYTIKLTVTNKDGQSSTSSSRYFVVCSRGMGYGAHGE